MPGGTGGPHRIQGVGFWAQQKYYNIFSVDSGPFVFRPPLKGLPEQPYPPNAFQSWTYQYNLNLIGQDRMLAGKQYWDRPMLPIPPAPPTWTGTFPPMMPFPTNVIFRPYWRGLPEQPPIPLLQQAVFQSWNVIYGAAIQAPFSQDDWPNPQQPWRLDQTWTRSYNLNLIGQDAMLVGEQRYELAPSQVPPEQIQLHSWAWSYNLSLVGKDRLPIGEQRYELAPGQVTPEQIQLHSWSWSYNLNLRGKDQLPTGVQRYDLSPIWPPYINQLRTWSWQYNLNLIGQDRFPTGEQVWERPILPVPPAAPTWAWQYNPNLIGQDFLPFRQRDWPLPIAPQQPALSWTDPAKIWLTAPVLNISISQYWDRPQLPVPPAQTWTWRQVGMIGQDQMATGEQRTELPDRGPLRAQDLLTWIQTVNLALVTAPPVLNITVSKVFDRPILPIPPAVGWEASYNKNLIGQDQLPFRQQDWPLTRAVDRAGDWIQQTALVLTAVQRPFVQSDWPLPQVPQGAIQTWINTIALALTAKPFTQTDWPNPTPFARDPTLATITASYNRNLVGQDRLPNRQQDWPLSSAHILSQIPLQIMVQGKWFNLVPPVPLPPGVQFYDRTIDPRLAAADIAWPAWRWPQITPPPVSAIVPLRTLMGTGV